MKKLHQIHPAWLVCAACALFLFCNMGLNVNAFSIYSSYMLSINHFSNSQVSALTTMRSLTIVFGTFLTSRYYARLKMRPGILLAGSFVACGFFTYAIANLLADLGITGSTGAYLVCCLAAAISGIGYGLGTMIPLAIMLDRWFADGKGTATGICTCLTGLSTLGIPSLIANHVESKGLASTFFIEGCVIEAAILLVFFLLNESPEESGVSPFSSKAKSTRKSGDSSATKDADKSKNKAIAQSEDKAINKSQAKSSTKRFALPAITLMAAAAYTSTGYSHLSVLITSEGNSPHTAALIIMGSGLAVTASKFLFGRLSEKISTWRCNWIFGFLTCSGLALACIFHSNVYLLGAGIVIFSAGLGMTTVGLVIWATELSAPGEFEATNHRYQTTYSIGTLICSFLPGLLADFCGGSYVPAFWLLTACVLVVIFTVQRSYRLNNII